MDGIAGSGKTTILNAFKEKLKKDGVAFFDQQEWSKNNNKPPEISDFENFDILFTFEPSKYWIGSAIRKELSFGGKYNMRVQAQAFAIDRMIHFNRIIIPALKMGKTIIQDRSITSSIVYQGFCSEENKVEEILNLDGNRLALEFPPSDIILTKADIEVVAKRTLEREDESKGVYEKVDWLTMVQGVFHGEDFQKIFLEKNGKIHVVDTNEEEELTLKKTNKLLNELL